MALDIFVLGLSGFSGTTAKVSEFLALEEGTRILQRLVYPCKHRVHFGRESH